MIRINGVELSFYEIMYLLLIAVILFASVNHYFDGRYQQILLLDVPVLGYLIYLYIKSGREK